jgi:sec-independent protein translocase protein TatB
MFDVAPSELMLLAVVTLVVIGPKELPRVMRTVGTWMGRARGMANQFKAGLDEMVREAELAEMEKHWKAENERIMREHQDAMAALEGQVLPASAPPALESPVSESRAPESPAREADVPAVQPADRPA